MRHGFRAPQDPAFPRFRTDLPMPSGRSQTLQHRLSFIRSLRVVRLQVIARPAFLPEQLAAAVRVAVEELLRGIVGDGVVLLTTRPTSQGSVCLHRGAADDGGTVIFLVSLVTGEMVDFRPAQVSAESALGFSYLVVLGSLLAFASYTWLLQNAPIQRVATYAYVNPVVAIVLDWLILSEKITGTILFGAAVIVSSVAFIVRRESAPAPEEESASTSTAEEAAWPSG